MENKENWQFERSSGYAGYRNKVTSEWIYEEDYLKLFSPTKEEPKQTDWKDSTKALMEAYGDNPKDFPYENLKQEVERLEDIKLENFYEVDDIFGKLAVINRNQEKILKAIKLLVNGKL